jgi:membrane complex biogenesis BtpA family protein
MTYLKPETILNKNTNITIGALHLPPLPGYEDFPGFDIAIENAIFDAKALEQGGADAIIFENNYDIPHTMEVSEEVIEAMIKIGKQIKSHTSIPLGVSVLWNDYKAALKIAKEVGATFIRVPVFVDKVQTAYGYTEGEPEKVIDVRKELDCESVALFVDIHVKHSEVLTNEPIEVTAKRAVEAGADALIVTGKWTGDAPDTTELKSVREAVGDFPIFCGSGVDANNVKELYSYANGAIVSTSLKAESDSTHEVNLKPYDVRISEEKTLKLSQLLL